MLPKMLDVFFPTKNQSINIGRIEAHIVRGVSEKTLFKDFYTPGTD